MKNSDAPQNYPRDDRNSQNPSTDPKSTDPKGNPYDSQNLDQESESDSKDITEQDIEKDLKENDPSQGFETDIDTTKDDKAEMTSFKPVNWTQITRLIKNSKLDSLAARRLKTMNSAGMK